MEQLQREVQSLTDKLRQLQTTAAKPKRQRRRRAASAAVPSGSSQPGLVSVPVKTGRRRNKKSKLSVQAGLGTLTLQRREFMRSVSVGAKGAVALDYVDIVPKSFSFLKQFTMFDRVKWNKLHVFYKPGVGANYNGFVSYGVLWGFDKAKPSDRAGISSLTPNMSHAVWVDGEARPLVCPPQKLQTRPWFTPDDSDAVETGPGRIIVAAESPSNTAATDSIVGELWVDYSVTLTGSTF